MNADALAAWVAAVAWVAAAIPTIGGRQDRTAWPTRLTAVVLLVAALARSVTGERSLTALPMWLAVGAVLLGALAVGQQRPRAGSTSGRIATAVFNAVWMATYTVLACLLSTFALVGVPDPVSTPGNVLVAVAGALVLAVHATPLDDAWRWVVPAARLVAALAISATASVLVVHYGFGDPDAASVDVSAAIVAAAISSAVVTVAAVSLLGRRADDATTVTRAGVVSQLDWLVGRDLDLDEVLAQTAENLRVAHDLGRVEIWTGIDTTMTLVSSSPPSAPRVLALSDAAVRVAASTSEPVRWSWVRVWMPDLGAHGHAAIPEDDERAEPALAPINYGGELRGLVLVAPRRGGPPIDDDVLHVVRQVAQRLGSVVHSAAIDDALAASLEDLRERERELRASRVRLVAAADAERERIERDLHDGAQQQLVALAVNLRLVRSLIDDDPVRARALVDQLHRAAQDTAQELRSLSHGIYPMMLRDEGIGPALDDATSRLGVPVRVRADPGRLPLETEAAVYFVCMEAIGNSLKHAGASAVDVTVRFDAGGLVFEVRDDGGGFDASTATSGRGLQNMRDRLGAVDGDLTVASDASGTRVVGTVPGVRPGSTVAR